LSIKNKAIYASPGGPCVSRDAVLLRNRILEDSSFDRFLFRFGSLLIRVNFFYKFIEENQGGISDHAHWQWEITRIPAGSAEYQVQPGTGKIIPNDSQYLIIPPRAIHQWTMTKSPFLTNSWQVQIDAADTDGQRILKLFEQSVEEKGFLTDASTGQIQAEWLMWEMLGNISSAELAAPILFGFAQVVIGELLAQIIPWPKDLISSRSVSCQASFQQQLACEMKLFLDEHLLQQVKLENMESHFHYSKRHLNRIFRLVYRISIGEYLHNERIDISKRWLEASSRSIKDIALSLGYTDSSQFSRWFLKYVRQTPSQYREARRTQKDEAVLRSVLNA